MVKNFPLPLATGLMEAYQARERNMVPKTKRKKRPHFLISQHMHKMGSQTLPKSLNLYHDIRFQSHMSLEVTLSVLTEEKLAGSWEVCNRGRKQVPSPSNSGKHAYFDSDTMLSVVTEPETEGQLGP